MTQKPIDTRAAEAELDAGTETAPETVPLVRPAPKKTVPWAVAIGVAVVGGGLLLVVILGIAAYFTLR